MCVVSIGLNSQGELKPHRLAERSQDGRVSRLWVGKTRTICSLLTPAPRPTGYGDHKYELNGNKHQSQLSCSKGRVCSWGLSGLFLMQAPSQILAVYMVTISIRLAEAVEVALPHLFPANCGSSNLDETGCAKRRAYVVRSPRGKGILRPLFAALNTFDTQFIHGLYYSSKIYHL